MCCWCCWRCCSAPNRLWPGRPQEAAGEWTYIPAVTSVKQAGPNLFVDGTDVGTWTGTFEGTSTKAFVVVCHPSAGFSFCKGTMEFTGSVEGRDGTMTLKTNGIQESDTCDPAPQSGRDGG